MDYLFELQSSTDDGEEARVKVKHTEFSVVTSSTALQPCPWEGSGRIVTRSCVTVTHRGFLQISEEKTHRPEVQQTRLFQERKPE